MIKGLKVIVFLLVVALLGILASSCFNLQSLKVKLEVIVKDNNEKPVEGARVEAEGFRGLDEGITGPDGKAYLEVLPGIYNIRASKEGYAPDSKRIKLITGSKFKTVELKLKCISGGVQELQQWHEEEFQQQPPDYEVMGVRLLAPGNGEFAKIDNGGDVKPMELSWEFHGNWGAVETFVLEVYKYQIDAITGEPTFTLYETIPTKNLNAMVDFYPGIYIWHVYVKYTDGTAIYSDPRTLTVGFEEPNITVTLINPQPVASSLSEGDITFEWEISGDSNNLGYELYVIKVNLTKNGVVVEDVKINTGNVISGEATSVKLQNFTSGPYLWFVIAKDEDNKIASEVWTFPVGEEGEMVAPPESPEGEEMQYQYPSIYIDYPQDNYEEIQYELPAYISFLWEAFYFTTSPQATMIIDGKSIKVPIDKVKLNGNCGEYSDENWYIYRCEDQYGGYLWIQYSTQIDKDGKIHWSVEFSDGKVMVTDDATFTIKIEK